MYGRVSAPSIIHIVHVHAQLKMLRFRRLRGSTCEHHTTRLRSRKRPMHQSWPTTVLQETRCIQHQVRTQLNHFRYRHIRALSRGQRTRQIRAPYRVSTIQGNTLRSCQKVNTHKSKNTISFREQLGENIAIEFYCRRGSWTRVLLIVDGEDLDNCPASEFHVKDSKSGLVEVQRLPGERIVVFRRRLGTTGRASSVSTHRHLTVCE